MFPEGAELAYSVIPKIPTLSPELREQTQQAFAESLHLVWVVMVALCGAGMLSVALIKDFSLRKTTDKQWGLKEKEKNGNSHSVDVTEAEAKQDEEASVGVSESNPSAQDISEIEK